MQRITIIHVQIYNHNLYYKSTQRDITFESWNGMNTQIQTFFNQQCWRKIYLISSFYTFDILSWCYTFCVKHVLVNHQPRHLIPSTLAVSSFTPKCRSLFRICWMTLPVKDLIVFSRTRDKYDSKVIPMR